MAVKTGVIARLYVAGQEAQVNLQDIDAIMYGDEAFKLSIPVGGLSLKGKDLLDFLKGQLHFDESGLPPKIKEAIDKSSITLHKLMYKQCRYQTKDGKRIPPEKDKDGNLPSSDFAISLTLAFSPDGTHSGLLSELTGVDLTSIIDVKACTFNMYTEYFQDEFLVESKVAPLLPPIAGKTPNFESESKGTTETKPDKSKPS